MSRYFSKLAERTGIAANSAGKMRRQTARANIRPAVQPNKRASLKRGLEANVEKIVEPGAPQRNSVTEFSAREHDPSHSLKADSVKKDSDNDAAAVLPNIPEMTVPAHVPQPGILKGEDQQSRAVPAGDNQLHETSSATTAVKDDAPNNGLLIDKRQYIASPGNRAPRQNHFDKSDMTNSLSRPKSERQHIRAEKTIALKTISPESESREARESGDDPFFDPRPYKRIKETPSTSLAPIESSEKTRPRSGTRTIHLVSESGRTAETKLKKAEPPAHDNSVDIRIGTISFEVHQAPEENTVRNPPPPLPRPVVIQQTHSPKTPRLSRYYLRGI